MFQRCTILGLLAASALLFGSGCWPTSASADAAVGRATEKALESTTIHFELETSIEGVSETKRAGYGGTATGAFDSAEDRGMLLLEAPGFDVEIRSLGNAVYMHFPDEGWYVFDEEELDLAYGSIPDFDPFALLRELHGSIEAVEDLGSSDVRGNSARRYRLTIASRRFDDDVIEPLLTLTRDIRVDFWIGEDGLPARIVLETRGTAEDFDFEGEQDAIAWISVDFVEYGTPVTVEAPPEDQLQDFNDFVGVPTDDPFEGAECYGDRLDECLGVNPELDAMAQDPSVCQGLDVRICLVPIGKVRTDVVQAVVDFHKETKNLDVVVLPSVAIPPGLPDRSTSQLTTKEAFELVADVYGVSNATPSTFVVTSPIDFQSGDFGWVFGTRYGRSGFDHNHGAFSYFRMLHVEPYDGSPITEELIHLRVAKYVARYTALLHLDYPLGDEIGYLNYSDMYGFSDLDSIGDEWPVGDPPCLGYREVICVIPDSNYHDEAFEDDVRRAAERIAKELNLPVEFRAPQGGFEPSQPDWGKEYASDLKTFIRDAYHHPQMEIVGVTDDALAHDASISPHADDAWPDLKLAVVSGADAGRPGTAQHRERMYRLVLRGVLRGHFGMELNDDPASLLYRGITAPADLDGKTIPTIPK